jgi:hypothetical protein
MTGQKWSGQHRRLSEKLRARAIGQLCHFCGLPMLPGQPLDLDHAPDGRGYRGVTHRHCNRADGGRKSLAIQRARGRPRTRRFLMPSEAAYGIEISTDRTHTSVVEAGRGPAVRSKRTTTGRESAEADTGRTATSTPTTTVRRVRCHSNSALRRGQPRSG